MKKNKIVEPQIGDNVYSDGGVNKELVAWKKITNDLFAVKVKGFRNVWYAVLPAKKYLSVWETFQEWRDIPTPKIDSSSLKKWATTWLDQLEFAARYVESEAVPLLYGGDYAAYVADLTIGDVPWTDSYEKFDKHRNADPRWKQMKPLLSKWWPANTGKAAKRIKKAVTSNVKQPKRLVELAWQIHLTIQLNEAGRIKWIEQPLNKRRTRPCVNLLKEKKEWHGHERWNVDDVNLIAVVQGHY